MANNFRPQVIKDGDNHAIKLGPVIGVLLASFVMATLAGLSLVGVLAWRADDTEKDVAAIKNEVERQGRNEVTLDTGVRETQRDIRWANDKLEIIMDDAQITKRPPLPPLPRSQLERRHGVE